MNLWSGVPLTMDQYKVGLWVTVSAMRKTFLETRHIRLSDELEAEHQRLSAIHCKRYGCPFPDVPHKYRTEEFFLEEVKNNGLAFYHVPELYKTREMCRAAVQNTDEAKRFVPEWFLKELYEEAHRRAPYERR